MAMRQKGARARRSRSLQGALVLSAAALPGAAAAGSFDLFGIDASYNVQLLYSLATRIEDRDDGIVNSGPAPSIPLPDFMKVPESWNYDDGDNNFDRWALINNRLSALGEFQLQKNEYGLLVRGDGFYDRVYRTFNDNKHPESVNKVQPPAHNQFTDEAERYAGRRARLLDAYAYGSWYLSDEAALNVRVGSHIAAWGESLFFSGIALAQTPADATKATVPGADVKSILLPVNQISFQLSATSNLTLLGQYKLDFKPTEINPPGEFFSPADVLGPGAEFIYGIYNPLYLPNLARADLTEGETLEDSLVTIANLVPGLGFLAPIFSMLPTMPEVLPSLHLPLDLIEQPFPNTPVFINVQRAEDIVAPDHGQYGVGIKYQVTPITNVGLFRLRYHNTIGLPVQNYGFATLIPGDGIRPDITTNDLGGLYVPVTYNVKYFDGVDMTAMSATTSLWGANIGLELTWREGIPVLVDIPSPLLGPVPTPARSDLAMIDLNALYLIGPALFWDSFVLVGDVGFNHVEDVEEVCSPTACSQSLTYDRDAWAWAFLGLIDKKNFTDGWDWNIPISLQGVGNGHTSLLGGFGSLMGEGDFRAGIGINFTYLQQTTIGFTYSGFLGRPDFRDRPYQDRDNLGLTVTYRF